MCSQGLYQLSYTAINENTQSIITVILDITRDTVIEYIVSEIIDKETLCGYNIHAS